MAGDSNLKLAEQIIKSDQVMQHNHEQQTAHESRQIQENMQMQAQSVDWVKKYQLKLSELKGLETEIKKGPPSELSKKEQEAWTQERNDRLLQVRQQKEMTERLLAETASRVEKVSETFHQVSGGRMEEMTVEKIQQTLTEQMSPYEGIDWERVQNEAEPSVMLQQLVNIWEVLQTTKPEQLTTEMADLLIERYKGLKLNMAPNAAQFLDETAGMDPASAHLLLCHCTATALKYELLNRENGQDGARAFFDIYQRSAVYTTAAAALCLSKSFLEQRGKNKEKLRQKRLEEEKRLRDEEQKKEEKRKAEEAKKKQEELEQQELEELKRQKQEEETEKLRMLYLKTGTKDGEEADGWVLASYAEQAAEVLKEYMKTGTDNEFYQKAQKLNVSCQDNIKLVRNYVQDQKKDILVISKMAELYTEKALQQLGIRLLQENAEELKNTLDGLLQGEQFKELRDLNDKYRRRQQSLLQMQKELDSIDGLWENPEMQELLAEQDDAVFAEKANKLCLRVQWNFSHMREYLGSEVMKLNLEKVVQRLKEDPQSVDILLFGTLSETEDLVEEFTMELSVRMPEVMKTEAAITESMRKNEIAGVYQDALDEFLMQNMKPDELDNAQKLEGQIQAFKKWLEIRKQYVTDSRKAEWNAAQVAAAENWLIANVALEEQEFRKKFDQYLADAGFVNIKEAAEEKKAPRVAKRQGAAGLFRKHLCSFGEEYGEGLKGREDKVMAVLDELLKRDKEFQAKYLQDKQITNIGDLDTLNTEELMHFMEQLRTNIQIGLDSWSRIECIQKTQVQDNLLSKLLRGELKSSTIEQEVRAQLDVLKNEQKAMELRFDANLLMDGMDENFQFEWIKSTERTWFHSDINRIPGRIKRMKKAHDLWNYLHDCPVLSREINDANITELLSAIQQGEGSKQIAKRVEDFLTGLIRELESLSVDNLLNFSDEGLKMISRESAKQYSEDELKQYIEEAKTYLGQIRTDTKKNASNFMVDFLLCDAAEPLYRIGGRHQDDFLATKSGDLEEKIAATAQVVAERTRAMEEVLKEADPATKDEIRRKMRKLIAGIEPFGKETAKEGERQKNLESFGVQSWEEALKKLENYLKPGHTNENGKFLKERQKWLEEYDNGKFRKLLPRILEEQRAWYVFVNGTKEELLAYLKPLEKVMEQLNAKGSKLSEYGFFHDQPLLVYCKEILRGEEPAGGWQEVFLTYLKKLENHSFAKKTLIERSGDVDKFKWAGNIKGGISYNPLNLALTNLMWNNTDIWIRLFDDKAFDELLKELSQNIDANTTYMQSNPVYQQKDEKWKAKFNMDIVQKISEQPKVFQKKLTEWIEAYDRIAEVKVESGNALQQKADILEEIRDRKEVVKEVCSAQDKQIEELKKQAAKFGSPVLLWFGRKETVSGEDLKKAEEEIAKNKELGFKKEKEKKKAEETDEEKAAKEREEFYRSILVEQALADAKEDGDEEEKQKEQKQLLNWLKAMGEAVDEQVKLPESRKKKLLLFLLGKEVMLSDTKESEKWDKAHCAGEYIKGKLTEYQEKEKQIEQLKKMLLTLPDGMDELAKEMKDFISGAEMGMYTMAGTEFDALVKSRQSYFKNVIRVDAIFDKAVDQVRKKQELSDDAVRSIKVGMREYFRLELMTEVSKEQEADWNTAMERDAVKLLEKPFATWYLADDRSLMQQVFSTDLKGKEIVSGNVVSRLDFENKIAQDDKLLEEYNALDIEERRIFALALTSPGLFAVQAQLPCGMLLRDPQAEQIEQRKISIELQKYIDHKEFDPDIDYTLAVRKLQAGSDKVNKDVFQEAMAFTKECIARYKQNIPKDFSRLSDAAASLSMAKILSREAAAGAADMVPVVTDRQSFVDQIVSWGNATTEKARHEKDRAEKTLKRLEALKSYQYDVLIRLLQDRTALDYTTCIDAFDRAEGKIHGFVNEEKRQKLFDIYSSQKKREEEGENKRLNSKSYQKALQTLCSYQIRDDVDLSDRSLKKDDFVEESLNRKTIVDWNLLDRALDFMQEIEQEKLRLEVVKHAVERIEESENEEAKKEYQKLKQEKPTDQKSFEKFFRDHAVNDKAQLLYIGYQSLGEREKKLFLKVLCHRDFLDVSRVNHYYNVFGLTDLDYVNPKGRDGLVEEYMDNSWGNDGGVRLEKDSYYTACATMLSPQINDDHDFAKLVKEQKPLESVLVENSFFESTRKTAVDWTLVARALQFVQRTANERQILLEDRTVYFAMGNLEKNGSFQFESQYLRKNYYNAGNRFTRYFGKRVKKKAVEYINENLPAGTATAIRMLLPVEWSNKLNKMDILENGDAIDNLKEGIQSVTNEQVAELSASALKKIRENKGKTFTALLETAKEESKKQLVDHVVEQIEQYVGEGVITEIAKSIGDQVKSDEPMTLDGVRKVVQEKGVSELVSKIKETAGEGVISDLTEAIGEKLKSADHIDTDELKNVIREQGVKCAVDQITSLFGGNEFMVNLATELGEKIKENKLDQKSFQEIILKQVEKEVTGRLGTEIEELFQKQLGDNALSEALDGMVDKLSESIDKGIATPEQRLKRVKEALTAQVKEELEEKVLSQVKEVVDNELFSSLLDITVGELENEESSWSDKIDNIVQKVEEDSDDLLTKSLDTVQSVLEKSPVIMKSIQAVSGFLNGEPLEKLADLKDDEFVTGIFNSVKDKVELNRKFKQAEKENRKKDQEMIRKAQKDQTEDEAKLTKSGVQRNLQSQSVAYDQTQARKTDKIVTQVADKAGSVIATLAEDESGLVKQAVKEVGELINFIRSYINEKASIVKYYQGTGELEKIRQLIKESQEELGMNGDRQEAAVDDVELLRQVKGFLDYTEMATFIGFNVVRSILFCAGKFNPLKETRKKAELIMIALGMKEEIGKEDTETAVQLLNALMGQYRG